jgi:DUF971 family protein
MATALRPERFEVVGDFLAIRWNDGEESILSLEELRRACPCARCAGEPDITGRVHTLGPAPSYTEASFEVEGFEAVGSYAVALRWGDGHDTGIYSFEMLRRLGQGSEGS